MFDNNQMFSNAQVVSADGFSTSAVFVGKTGPDGVWIEVVIPAAPTGTSPTLNVNAHAKDADSSWSASDPIVGTIGNQINGSAASQVGRYFMKVVTDRQYVRLYYDVGGTTPSYTLTAGVVSGPQQDAVV
jgi:hypothetical protein